MIFRILLLLVILVGAGVNIYRISTGIGTMETNLLHLAGYTAALVLVLFGSRIWEMFSSK